MYPSNTVIQEIPQYCYASIGSGLFSLDPGLMIWTWVVFALLVIILRKYAWTPMMESIRSREKVLSDAVENARKTKEELENISLQQSKMLQGTQEEIRKMIESGRRNAEETAKDIVAKASKDAQDTLIKAKDQITQEKIRVLNEIKEQTVDMIIRTSEKVIETELDDDAHRKIIEKRMEEL